jgi:transposase
MSDTPELTRLDGESLQQQTPEQLVSIVVQQQALIERQQALIEQLQQEIERLKLQQQSNSQTSSKPPSTDLIQKSEKPKNEPGQSDI